MAYGGDGESDPGVQTNGIQSTGHAPVQGADPPPSKLILCFDGTGNSYTGDTSDTNIVKLYQKFDRDAGDQYHYYQPGIGTYSADEKSLNAGYWGRFKRWISEAVDEGVGTTFDQHVIGGYKFIQRYYNAGDKIYIFGFSRGAFTARFLARMIATVGLLSRGNEEMVAFAYVSYQDYELGGGRFSTAQQAEHYMNSFKTTFCRAQVRVHFLGLFDTVNSVGLFDWPFSRTKYLPSVLDTAAHVRHAVAIDERRAKFKAALLQQDKTNANHVTEDIKEVYFPGQHGDIGGGWLAEGNLDVTEENDPLQLSDITLEWMITEIENLPIKKPEHRISWNKHKDIFLNNFRRKSDKAVSASMHDVLKFGGGISYFGTFCWHILEWLPIFKRLELIKSEWKSVVFPPNMGASRDIPEEAVFHPAVQARMMKLKDYRPKNQGICKLNGA